MREVCAEPNAQYKSNVDRTVCTTKTRGSISLTFYNVVEKRNPYQSKYLRRRPVPTPASL